MKKEYKKPEIFMESFEVSEFIATACQNNVNATQDTCTVQVGTEVVFTSSNNTCTVKANDGTSSVIDEEYNSFCYHIPLAGTRSFGS